MRAQDPTRPHTKMEKLDEKSNQKNVFLLFHSFQFIQLNSVEKRGFSCIFSSSMSNV